MLPAEEARARLASLADPGWRDAAARRVGKVKRRDRGLGNRILDAQGASWDRDWQRWCEDLDAVGHDLDALDERRRTDLLSALHPGLGPALSRWWVAARAEPYQSGYVRQPFRAPTLPRVTAQDRADRLVGVVGTFGPYAGDAAWAAAWAPYLENAAARVGPVLAAAIDGGDRAAYGTLTEIVDGTHPVGRMDRHVPVALLGCARPEAWEVVVRLLLAAQRQEGLRQSVLEVADEGHPQAFDRVLRAVLENDLLRFAAAVRAAAVWIGLPEDVQEVPRLRARVALLLRLRTDTAAREAAIASAEPWPAYLALYAKASYDVVPALRDAERLARHPDRDARATAVRFAAITRLTSGAALVWAALDDPDLAVAALAHSLSPSRADGAETFARLERLAERLPSEARTVEGVGVEPEPVELCRARVVGTLTPWEDAPIDRLLRWLPEMDVYARCAFARRLTARQTLTPEARRAVVSLLGDRSSSVRAAAVEAVKRTGLDPVHAPDVEGLLTRRSGDLRRAMIGLLAAQPPRAAVASAERLWASKSAAQRDAARELVASLGDAVPEAVALARRMDEERPAERKDAAVTGERRPKAGPWDGLYDPAARAPVPAPRAVRRKAPYVTDAALRAVSMLDDVVHAHADVHVTVHSWQGTRDVLLGDTRYELTWPVRPPDTVPYETADGFVLGEVFREAWAGRPAECRDAGALDALRAYVAVRLADYGDERRWQAHEPRWLTRAFDAVVPAPSPGELRYPYVVRHVLAWLALEEATPEVVAECLDATETLFASLRPDDITDAVVGAGGGMTLAGVTRRAPWHDTLLAVLRRRPDVLDAGATRRWFALARWFEQVRPEWPRVPVDRGLLLRAYESGAATDADVVAGLLHADTGLLADFTRRHRAPLEARHPRVVALADRVRDRVVEIERARGDLPTPATPLANVLGSVYGAGVAVAVLAAFGRSALVRGWSASESREGTWSRLLRVSYPAPDDTAETLATEARSRSVRDARLVDLAVYAPQWGALVERALGWPGLEDAVWWFHAHTKDDQWYVPVEVRDAWAARSAERTALSGYDLVTGAVDVTWFGRAYATLGGERWDVVHRAAKHASSAGGHKRAQTFADAMLGRLDEETLLARIRDKRNQDAVRALGLLPLPDGDGREATLLRRFGELREFERQAARYGSQRQASEKAAVRVGIDNLARTAGYPDPQRFTWAMEAAEAGALADGPIVVRRDDVAVTLSVSEEGVPSLGVTRGEKALTAVPAPLRKDPDVAALRERKTALTRQASRVRRALEEAMVRQESLTAGDLAALGRHPIVAPMLRLLVYVDGDGRTLRYTGSAFADVSGKAVRSPGDVRIAHPVDLLAAGDWVRWQEALFADGRRQPFKQVFRELYVVTAAEREEGPVSERYAGHQLQPRQALALLGGRGWVNDVEVGEVSRAFHEHGLVARLAFLDGFLTPLEVELPTAGGVTFTRRGGYAAEPLDAVPPVVFSEAMRDVDLVVSVAHAGGVDPEATASTVEMRAALVRETARLLRLGNVAVDEPHVRIDGALGDYTVHLGSGVVHRRPGGAVCIIPVDAQRRGRVFLPFADDDPRTAEVVSKVLLLANDRQIKDPTILEQLR